MTGKEPPMFSFLPILKILSEIFVAPRKPGSRFPLIEIPMLMEKVP